MEYELQKQEVFRSKEENNILEKAMQDYYQATSEEITQNPDYQEFLVRNAQGFEGFDAQNSGAPPHNVVEAGRCNPEKVSFLYMANDKHTAVAEVRPFITDAISVATLLIKKDLKIVDLYYETDENGDIIIDDYFLYKICCEFSLLNKGNKEDYLITQYLTSLAKSAGMDGIRFRSSLVKEGINYVIFDNENCIPIASKMYIIPEIKYSLLSILDK